MGLGNEQLKAGKVGRPRELGWLLVQFERLLKDQRLKIRQVLEYYFQLGLQGQLGLLELVLQVQELEQQQLALKLVLGLGLGLVLEQLRQVQEQQLVWRLVKLLVLELG